MSFTSFTFDAIANNVLEWIHVADDLAAAERLLSVHSYHLNPERDLLNLGTYDEFRITPVILMLRAMNVECLLKALYVKHCGKLGESGRYKNIGRNDHNLHDISEKINKVVALGFAAEEQKFLKRLSRNITRGRYPIDKTWQKFLNPPATAGNRFKSSIVLPTPFDEDNNLYQAIVMRLRELLKNDIEELYGRYDYTKSMIDR